MAEITCGHWISVVAVSLVVGNTAIAGSFQPDTAQLYLASVAMSESLNKHLVYVQGRNECEGALPGFLHGQELRVALSALATPSGLQDAWELHQPSSLVISEVSDRVTVTVHGLEGDCRTEIPIDDSIWRVLSAPGRYAGPQGAMDILASTPGRVHVGVSEAERWTVTDPTPWLEVLIHPDSNPLRGGLVRVLVVHGEDVFVKVDSQIARVVVEREVVPHKTRTKAEKLLRSREELQHIDATLRAGRHLVMPSYAYYADIVDEARATVLDAEARYIAEHGALPYVVEDVEGAPVPELRSTAGTGLPDGE